MIGLTPKQSQLFRYLEGYMSGPGSVAPTFAEMGAAVGLTSKSAVHRLLSALEERAYIRRIPNRARAIEIIRDGDRRQDVAHALTLASDYQLQAEINRRRSIPKAA
ncbi:hypothetical protein V474_07865 [Novosphingobium barchaimii LL02]|uniref:LexA repressor DNA-binding domain-containing protein n=1 Tax=Novosphingobium barchaimii LL02 TaxID=1114963 RepID=A0A0J8B0S1_9SPHN|nr:hypothetical protein [Novosphingobium barchaimii]KMS59995.1 hypothetical protein V474_07865 [Novosphingobium barchaimii LL02]